MVKFACNAFHAIKVDFANEIGGLCARLGISGDEVMEAVRSDAKLNASPAYLKPGFAFGGSCLSKDVRALVGAAAGLKMRLPLLESALPSNDEHLERAKRAVLGLPAQRLGVVGLAFKENTDDLRGSAVLPLLDALLASGRPLRVFDPQIRLDRIYGSNLNSLLSAIPEVEQVLAHRLEDLLLWADHIVIVQSLPAEVSRQIALSGLPVLNLAATT
jgi:GDP-mannose 6-dehydrogenase